MNMKFAAATALVSSLLVQPLMQGSAHSASLPSLPSHSSGVTLVAHGGGAGGGGGGGANFSGGGGGHMGGGGGGEARTAGGGGPHDNGGPHAMGGNGPHGMGNGPHMRGGNFAQRDVREFQRGRDFSDHNRGRFAERDHNFDHHHGHGHRVFRNGVWVWVYGPDYYAGDCGWLLRRARVTGSPYWWSRYNACVGYY